jgi:hypothetical protein
VGLHVQVGIFYNFSIVFCAAQALQIGPEVSRDTEKMKFVSRWQPKAFRKLPEQFKDSGFRTFP